MIIHVSAAEGLLHSKIWCLENANVASDSSNNHNLSPNKNDNKLKEISYSGGENKLFTA